MASALDEWCITHGAEESARWEMEQIIEEGHRLPVVGVVEIGTHQGASLAIWREEFCPLVLLGMEPELSERTLAGVTKRSLLNSMLWMSSEEMVSPLIVRSEARGRRLNFLYIDGDHSERQVRHDFSRYGQLLVAPALIVLDDAVTVGVAGTEVHKVVPEIQRHWRTKLVYGGGDSGGKLLVFV